MRLLLVSLLLLTVLTPLGAADAFDQARLQRVYAANNSDELPLVSWMDWGIPKFVLYADGTIIAAEQAPKKGLVSMQLGADELQRLLSSLSTQEAFWSLGSKYELSRASDQPLSVVTVRIPGKKRKSVSVYGRLQPRSADGSKPPEAFMQFIDALAAQTSGRMTRWDPGYVEILWSDYGYAPDRPLPWPAEWPGFESPLVRSTNIELIPKIMIFPSSELPALDDFLAQRPERGAILINGRKMSAHYRWPIRSEKKWNSWNQ